MDLTLKKKKNLFQFIFACTRNYPGDTFKGIVRINLDAPLKYDSLKVQLRGVEVVRFGTSLNNFIENDVRHTTYYRQDILIAGKGSDVSKKGGIDTRGGILSGENGAAGPFSPDASFPSSTGLASQGFLPGTYSFPFSVDLPDVLPPSFEMKTGFGFAQLAYSAKAVLLVGAREVEGEDAVFGVRMLPLNPMKWISEHSEKSGIHAGRGNENLDVSQNGTTSKQLNDHPLALFNNGISEKSRSDEVEEYKKRDETSDFTDEEEDYSGSGGDGSDDDASEVTVQINTWFVDEDNGGSGSHHNVFHSETSKTPPGERTKALASQEGVAMGFPSEISEYCVSSINYFKDIPPCEKLFDVRINGFLRSGVATVHLTLSSMIYSRGDTVAFRAIIDNEDGLATIQKITFTIVSYVYMESKADSHEFKIPVAKKVMNERVSLHLRHNIPEERLVIPKHTPLTLATDSIRCRSFLEVSVTCAHVLKKHTGTARTEVVIVDEFTLSDEIPRLQKWKNDFRGHGIGANQAAPPLVYSPFALTGNIRVVKDELDDGNTLPSGQCVGNTKQTEKGKTPEVGYPTDFENSLYFPMHTPTSANASRSKNPLS